MVGGSVRGFSLFLLLLVAVSLGGRTAAGECRLSSVKYFQPGQQQQQLQLKAPREQ